MLINGVDYDPIEGQFEETEFYQAIVVDTSQLESQDLHPDEQFIGIKYLGKSEDLPRTIGDCESELGAHYLDQLEGADKEPDEWTFPVGISPKDLAQLVVGRVIHNHTYEVARSITREGHTFNYTSHEHIVCLDPALPLSPEEIDRRLQEGWARREAQLEAHIAKLAVEEARFYDSREHIQPNAPFLLFSGANIEAYDGYGLDVPEKILHINEREDTLVIAVDVHAYNPEHRLYGNLRGGGAIYSHEFFPFGNPQDNPGVDYIAFEISLGNYQHSIFGYKEQRVVLQVGSEKWFGQIDSEEHALSQGASGTFPYSYNRFFPENPKGPLFYTEGSDLDVSKLRVGARIILPVDKAVLSEITAMFPRGLT